MNSENDRDSLEPREMEEVRDRLHQVLQAYVEGTLPGGLWAPAERLLDHLAGEEAEAGSLPLALSAELRGALARLRGAERSRLPMAASSAPAAEILLSGEQVGFCYGIALDVDGEGELVQVEVREIEIRPAERSRATINTYGPIARVVAIDGGIVANSQFTDSIRRIERLLEKNLPGREVHVECEVAYGRGADPSRRRTIEGSSLSGAVALAILSKLYSRPVQRRLAVSFSVNSDGTVGPVDQAVEKARVAARSGVEQMILPAANQLELAAVPPQQLPHELLYLRHIDELLLPGGASGAETPAEPLLRGFWGNLRHRALLREKLGPDRRVPGIIIGSGPNRGDTTLLT
jgi:Lon protease-like protein